MILYALRCAASHEFEGWFRNGAAFDDQSAAGEISCPVCGDTSVTKAPMAPRLGRSRSEERAAPADRPAEGKTVGAPTPAQVRKALAELRRQVEANCDYVGDRFAEEARRIHYGETDPRGIYGEATADDARSLVDEGIEFARIPWPSRTDA